MSRRAARLAAVPAAPDSDEPDHGADVAPGWQAEVDGARIGVHARDEVVIRCGKASIVMRRNGRIVIQGCYVETRSAGTNRIRGGQVRVN